MQAITIALTAPVISSIIAGTGLIGGFVWYLIRTDSAQNSRLDLLDLTVKTLSEQNLHTRVSVVEQGLADIKAKVAKLDLLEGMKATLEYLSGQMRDMQAQIVPRAEHQAHWRAMDERITDLSERSRESDERIAELLGRTGADRK